LLVIATACGRQRDDRQRNEQKLVHDECPSAAAPPFVVGARMTEGWFRRFAISCEKKNGASGPSLFGLAPSALVPLGTAPHHSLPWSLTPLDPRAAKPRAGYVRSAPRRRSFTQQRDSATHHG